MRIDLHCHTKATKSGDGAGRNVDKATFLEKTSGKVELVAITNHNYFDFEQFDSFSQNDNVQIWPGIEIDILESSKRYHCIVIANPSKIDGFKQVVSDLTLVGADSFSCTLDQFIYRFKGLDCIVIAHYFKKENAFDDEKLERLKDSFSDINVFVEPSNLRSATILQAHNYRCLIGSDIEDWNDYDIEKLPTLKKRFDSFDRFKLLLQKNEHIMKTTLKDELYDKITIEPFRDHSTNNHSLEYDIYRDVNVFFGSKGTGKSDILLALKEKLIAINGTQKVSYYKAKEVTNEFTELKKNNLSDEIFSSLQYKDVTNDISEIKNWQETSLIPTSDYFLWKKIESNNKNNRTLGFRNASFVEKLSLDKFEDFKGKLDSFRESKKSLINTINSENLLLIEEITIIDSLLNKAENNLLSITKESWIEFKSLELEKFTIDLIKRLSEKNTGEKSRPIDLGLYRTYLNLKKLETSFLNLKNCTSVEDKMICIPIGQLEDKGKIFLNKTFTFNTCLTHYKFENGKENVNEVKVSLEKCISKMYDNDFITEISNLKTKLTNFEQIRNFIGYKTFVALENGAEYNPSDGEQSMLLLSRALVDDNKSIYILDEPELSVGHQYINRVIIPRIKQLANYKKVIIIATHDANIATRTLPYLSVYRKYEDGKYLNFIGSSLEQNMEDKKNSLSVDWTEVSINTLEGGRDAFDERGRIYG